MTTYTPPLGYQVELPFFPPYTAPAGTEIDLPLGEIFGPPEPPDGFADPLTVMARAPWRQGVRRGLSAAIGHGVTTDRSAPWVSPWRPPESAEAPHRIPWARLLGIEESSGLAWREMDQGGATASVPWRRLQQAEKGAGLRWRNTRPLEAAWDVDWRAIVRQDIITGLPWARQAIRDVLSTNRWGIGRHVYPDWEIVWGFAKPPKTIVPNPIIFDPPEPIPPTPPVYTPPPGESVHLPLHCLRGSLVGNRVPLPFRQFECLRRSTVIENDIILKRVDTDEEVPALSLSIRGDIETATNTWAAQLPASALSIVEPTGDQPVECLATINGIDHLLLLERWGDSRRWTDAGGRSDTVTVQGSSISRELDAPYRAPGSRFEELTRSAFQLMQQELPLGSGWTLSKHPAWTDYGVPGGTWSYTDLTPLQAIVRIAAASGAVIQQVPDARELRVVPRYPSAPWNWDATEADKQVDFGLIVSASGEFRPVPRRNGVYVAGETNGVLVQAQRTGTAGDPWLDMVVDPLVTAAVAGLQRANAELGATGARSLYSAQMPIKVSEETPGLIQPGELVLVLEDEETSWKALAVDWSINGRWSDEDGLTIWADIGLERYRDE